MRRFRAFLPGEDAAEVVMTIKGGEVYTPKALMQPFAGLPAAARSQPRTFACTTPPE
jgi:hypothetical protein